jgi:hypothetical protein
MRGYGAGSGAPAVMLAYVKHLWATGARREALSRLTDLVVKEVSAMPATPQPFVRPDFAALAAANAGTAAAGGSVGVASSARKWGEHPKPPLVARAYLRLGLYDWHIQEARLEGDTIPRVMGRLRVRGGGGREGSLLGGEGAYRKHERELPGWWAGRSCV